MTDRKDFKRVVRARARTTGESYSSALRNVRNANPDRPSATASEGTDQREPLVSITRTIPDVRSTNIDKTMRFYTELIGFDTRTEDGRVVAFVSASHDSVEITLNRDESLPSGFTVEVETESQVAALFDRAPAADIRVIEPLREARFSVLDPAGHGITIAAAATVSGSTTGDTDRPIVRVIPETVLDVTAAKRFYVDYLGFEVRGEWPDTVMFTSSTSTAQVLAVGSLTSPNTFDLSVGTAERVDAIHAAAMGNAVVMGDPQDFPDKGIHGFMIIDPNGIAINVTAPIDPAQRSA